ncbi:hypothetical protein [Hyalangium rubrum]|uniref:Uncharacterized protein n=1 Tax=Hyalangium rubrum TaxID=3103134 RepID=A0ABU5H3J1_9BACT|nr:hypothetical protein [Hyalangium sp. s54d21]MDY7227368.1 hypothetical protein [Hyalangium sp. s54d21]
MDEFIKDLTSARFWVGVVAVGIVINLVSPLLQKALARSSSGLLSYWRSRSRFQQQIQDALIQRFRASEHEQVMAAIAGLRHLVRAVFAFGLAVSVVVVPRVAIPDRIHALSLEMGLVRGVTNVLAAYFLGLMVRRLGHAATIRQALMAARRDQKRAESESESE